MTGHHPGRTAVWLCLAQGVGLLGLVLAAGRAPAQDAPKPKPAETGAIISVKGEVEHPLELTAEQFAKLPRQTVHAKDHEGKEADYDGVAMVDVLKAAGVKFGQDMRGKALALYLVVEASDGYRAVFALPELDAAFTDRVILLADQKDKKPLDERHGPLQVIVPGEKKHRAGFAR